MDPTYPLFPIFAFLGFLLPLIPLPWHFQAWNSGTCYYMMWASIACLNQFVNSVVWHGNALNPAPIWCDISIRIMMAASVGLPASSLCINRRLYRIANVQSAAVTIADKRRAILIDTLICVVFPLLYIPLQYIVQGHRFNIYEDIGCYPALYNTLAMYFISAMWPIVIGLISMCYCVLSLRAFSRRRLEFAQFLSTNKSLTVGRYFRLMALATTEILFTVPLATFMIWLNATATPIGPWRSWADTHLDFFRMEQIPAVLWRSNHYLIISFEFTRWTSPACAIIFFAFFGFADEAQRHYRLAYEYILKRFGIKSRSLLSSSVKASAIKLPSLDTKSPKSFMSSPSTPTLPPYSPPPVSPPTDFKKLPSDSSHRDSFATNIDLSTIPPSPSSYRTSMRSVGATSTVRDLESGSPTLSYYLSDDQTEKGSHHDPESSRAYAY